MGNPITASIGTVDFTQAVPGYNRTSLDTAGAAMFRDTGKYVYIYNVGPLEHKIGRSWGHPIPGVGNGILIPACPFGEDYSHPVALPEVIKEAVIFTDGDGGVRFEPRDGAKYAQDVCNPEDPHGNWKSPSCDKDQITLGCGNNLYLWGVFWTWNNPPTKEELEKARSRTESHCNNIVEQGNALHVASQDSRYAGERVGPLHHAAATYLGIETDWHRQHTAKIPCPNCADPINPKAATCSHCGAVIDWDRAILTGKATRAQKEEAMSVKKGK